MLTNSMVARRWRSRRTHKRTVGSGWVSVMNAPTTEKQMLVAQARKVERLMARRRKLIAKVRQADEELRRARKFLRDLAMPTDEPMNRGELGELLPPDGGNQ